MIGIPSGWEEAVAWAYALVVSGTAPHGEFAILVEEGLDTVSSELCAVCSHDWELSTEDTV